LIERAGAALALVAVVEPRPPLITRATVARSKSGSASRFALSSFAASIVILA
jgi:hypothetical protein